MSKKTGGNKLHTNYQYKHVGGKRKTLKRSKPNTRKSKKTKKRKTLKKGYSRVYSNFRKII